MEHDGNWKTGSLGFDNNICISGGIFTKCMLCVLGRESVV